MNIQETMNTITKNYVHKVSEMTDSSAFAYVTFQLEELRRQGLNPLEYEVVFAKDEYAKQTEDGFNITNRIRLVKIADVADLPVREAEG